MTLSNRRSLVILVAAMLIGVGCDFTRRTGQNPLDPTPTPTPPSGGNGSMVGFWLAGAPGANETKPTCGQFAWTISEQTVDSITGTFTAVCLEQLVAGTASGKRTGDQVLITVTAQANLAGNPCNANITGNGQIVGEELHVNYSGQTCLGPISGFEILRRKTPAPPPPPETPPAPTPPPPPPPPSQPCAGLTQPYDILVCYRHQYGPHMSRDEHVVFLRDAMRHFNAVGVPDGPFGLLRKESGNNCNGYSCDVVCAGQGGQQKQWDVLINEEIPTWGPPISGAIRIDVCEIQ
jgi:hypothetical protein